MVLPIKLAVVQAMEMEKARRKSLVSKIKQSIEQNRGCGVLYLDTVTPDGFGSPKMKITVKYTGENGEIKLHFGSVKPEAVTFDLGGTSTTRFAIKINRWNMSFWKVLAKIRSSFRM